MRASRKGVTAALILALGGAVVSAGTSELEKSVLTNPTSDEATSQLARAYRESDNARRAVEFFSRFHEANKPNALSLVWQGAFKAMLSSKEADIEARLNLLQSGIVDMDRAVRLSGNDARTRAIRGMIMAGFPDFLQMYNKAIDDLEASLRKPDALSPGLQATVRERLAQAYRKAGRTADSDAMLKSVGSQ